MVSDLFRRKEGVGAKRVSANTKNNGNGAVRGTGARALRISIFYAAVFLGLGIFLPFFPVWLASRDLSAPEISLVLAAQMSVRILSVPLFAFAADRLGRRKPVIIGLSLMALAGVLVLSQTHGFWPIVLIATLASAAWTPIIPLIETLAVSESEAGGADYGRMRLWGSLSFIAGSVGSGYVLSVSEPGQVIWLLVAADVVLLAAAFALPGEPAGGIHEDRRPGARVTPGEVLRVVTHPLFMAFMASASIIQASHAVYYAFGTIHWQAAGVADQTIGMLWSMGVVAEIILFMFSRNTVRLCGPALLLIIGGAGAALRWSVTALEPGLALLFVAQAGHALTFGATHLGTMHFIARAVPKRTHASAQGAYAALSTGIVLAAVMWGAGLLYESEGAGAYFYMAAMGLVGVGFALVVALRWRGGELPVKSR